MEIFTIGFTKKTAREFFGAIKEAGVRRLVDVRLNNRSQLAGFTKQQDLEYFLAEICGAEYVHLPELAPTKEILRAYQQGWGHCFANGVKQCQNGLLTMEHDGCPSREHVQFPWAHPLEGPAYELCGHSPTERHPFFVGWETLSGRIRGF